MAKRRTNFDITYRLQRSSLQERGIIMDLIMEIQERSSHLDDNKKRLVL